MVLGVKHAAVCASALAGSQMALLISGEHHTQQDKKTTAAPCRVAVSISGDVRSFVDPVVHRSFRRYVVGAIENNGCQVDVFAYAMLEDDVDILLVGFAQDMADIETSIEFLSPTPTQFVWHQDQAGIIPNSCPGFPRPYRDGSVPSHDGSDASDGWGGGVDAGRRDGSRRRDEVSREGGWRIRYTNDAYWRLYGSLAAYRMALQKESERNEDSDKDGKVLYDWIVATRFDVAWIRPLPPLRLFSKDAVWFGADVWPVSNDFALVPRSFADRFFSAVSAFHSCDPGSWPPQEPWWQPNCSGNNGDSSGGGGGGGGSSGFEESILFRHLHATDVVYRPYPMFEYCVVQHSGSGCCGEGGGGGSDNSGERSCSIDCDVRATAVNHKTACILVGAAGLFRSSYSTEDCTAVLSEYSNLRCRALAKLHHHGNGGIGEFKRNDGEKKNDPEDSATAREAERSIPPRPRVSFWAAEVREREREGEQEEDSADDLDHLDRKRSKLIALRDAVMPGTFKGLRAPPRRGEEGFDVETVEPPTAESQSQQHQRRWRHTRRGEDDEQPPGLSDPEPVDIRHSWTVHSQEGCHIGEYPGRAPHIIRSYSSEKSLLEEVALAIKCFADQLLEGVGSAGGADDIAAATTCADFRPLELVMIDVSLHSEELGICTVDGSLGLTAIEHVQKFFADPSAHCPALYVGSILDPSTSSSTPCPELLVQAMEVLHPLEGAVYWEGPVNVSLEVTLTGSGVQGLSLRHVHACADTDKSWPIQDWSRYCVSLEELASPDSQPSLMFGSTIGVVEGSVSLRDARPGCFPRGSLRGPVLKMSEGSADDTHHQPLASRSMRFKIIHHAHTLNRRGRPIGPTPLGRGFATTQGFMQDLQREADAEADASFKEVESYLNHSRSGVATRNLCAARLDMQARGGALAISGHLAQFYADQLNWMISEKKLPPEMSFAIDRMREVQSILPDQASGRSFWISFVRHDLWKPIARFFQKSLLLPTPAEQRVVSTAPLQTWEYDEIPWMEALNPNVDWHAVEEAYLGNQPVPITHVDNFFSSKALAMLLDMARGTSIFVDSRPNYVGAYPSDGMSHPLLYQIAEEAAQRLPRILGSDTPGWPLVQMWFYMYGGNDGEKCTHGIRVHADAATVNLNVWLAPDSANLGSAETGDGGGLTVFHAKPPAEWSFEDFNADPSGIEDFLEQNKHAGFTSVPNRQNRALLFDSMLFHQSDPFRFKKGFENRRLNLTLLFGRPGK
ncbi:unnamed protein product, partial [Pylaiella littoralis]